jgi:hypothetical protein
MFSIVASITMSRMSMTKIFVDMTVAFALTTGMAVLTVIEHID